MSCAPQHITQERLKQLVSYDPDTGVFKWLGHRRAGVTLGATAGTVGEQYTRMALDGKRYVAHRLAWLYVHGEWCTLIDHIDGDKRNNRISNLRKADRTINGQNLRRAYRNNKLGLLGVSPRAGKFCAQIKAAGRPRMIGLYDTPEEAHAAYLEAKRLHHAGCTI